MNPASIDSMFLYLGFIALYLLLAILIGKHLSIQVDRYLYGPYKRKPRPERSKIDCPVSGRRLRDFELFYGTCSECRTKNECIAKMKPDVDSKSRKV